MAQISCLFTKQRSRNRQYTVGFFFIWINSTKHSLVLHEFWKLKTVWKAIIVKTTKIKGGFDMKYDFSDFEFIDPPERQGVLPIITVTSSKKATANDLVYKFNFNTKMMQILQEKHITEFSLRVKPCLLYTSRCV